MSVGPGIYDPLCTYVRETTDADAALVIILNGNRGSGFSCQSSTFAETSLPDMLEEVARTLRMEQALRYKRTH
jgi:hypothetical protein